MIQEGMQLISALFSTATTTTTIPMSFVSTPTTSIPPSSTQVTPETARLLDSLINTPLVVTTTTTTFIPIPTASIPVTLTVAPASTTIPPNSYALSSSNYRLRDDSDDYTHMVSTIVDLKARVVALESLFADITATNEAQQLLINTQRAQLLTQQIRLIPWESSSKQDNLRAQNDDEDSSDKKGRSEHLIASPMPSATHADNSIAQGESGSGGVAGDKGKGKHALDLGVNFDVSTEVDLDIDGEKISCLIDLDDVFIDDRNSEEEHTEIEFQKDDKGMTYETHEGFEIDASFINQVDDQVHEDKEKGEICEDISDKDENVEVPIDIWDLLILHNYKISVLRIRSVQEAIYQVTGM
ncbi:hypothetical protein L1987_43425 [Smallanthus sonchifolius]|uniref:Uncharacterized protein n=1 Tax=Smallanthus sonchifolius TaxID=185202 RepID=A0ACB9GLK2_9ASTR|nr:hypothetical protein L1987_43425 [Smallanthus sonchifolius]